MSRRYQDIYPTEPLLKSEDVGSRIATELLTLEYFEAEPSSMPKHVFEQHHILLNLKKEPHRVINWRDGVERDFSYQQNEIIVTPAGMESGWRWFAKSKVIVITLDPAKFERFALNELGVVLTSKQLKDIPQFVDEDLVQAGTILMDAMGYQTGSAVMFESLARVFLTKLILKYGLEREEDIAFSQSFTAQHYKKVLDYVADHFEETIALEDLAAQASLSTFHFARLFKETIGKSPHNFVMEYRVEQARKMLQQPDIPLIDIAIECGFSDQPHFSRLFKRFEGMTPKQYRQSL